MEMLIPRILITIGSVATIGFGVWHFFVPRIWNWYSAILPSATELVVAVRAINIFFSLSLVLFGAMNLCMIYAKNTNKYSILVVLCATCILWAVRVILQVVAPQGSMNVYLQYGMLLSFIIILSCYLVPLISMIVKR